MIRQLKQTDYTAAKRLFYNIFDQSEDPHFKKAWKKRDPEATLGIWSSGALLGAAIVSNNFLNYIYIDSSHRGGGTGTALLQAVLSVCPNIYLTPVNDPDVYRWYVKHGFHLSSIEGETRIYVRHRHNLRE